MNNPIFWAWRLITHNFGWKVLSIGLAVLVWVLVSSEPELSTFASTPLEYKNLSDDLEITSDLTESVYLELRGPAGELRSLSDVRRPAVVLDMTGVGPGERTFAIGYGNVTLPNGVRMVRAIPSQVRFEFDRRSSRTVPVEVRFGDPHPGYEVASFDVSPSELTIMGPAGHLARIASAQTDPVDVSGVIGEAQFRVSAFVDDAYVRFPGSSTVVVTVRMKRR